VIEQQLERLLAAGIQATPAGTSTNHFILERDGFAALVQCVTGDNGEPSFTNAGSAGLVTSQGFAALVGRGTEFFFVAKGFEQPATAERVANLRKFSYDLKLCIDG
jgi:hypothetical protein